MSMSVFAPNTCRGCASISDENKSLFHESLPIIAKTYPTKVAAILAECLSVKIFLGDGYPTTICIRCETQLLALDRFKFSALQVHKQHTDRIQNAGNSSSIISDSRSTSTDIRINADRKKEPTNINIDEDEVESIDAFELIDPLKIEALPNENVQLPEQFPGMKTRNMELYKVQEYRDKILRQLDAESECSDDDDALLIDNRQSLPEAIKTSTGVRCSFCKRGFTQRIFFEMHLCSNDGRTKFKCTNCDETLNNSEIETHVLPTLQCKASDVEELQEMPTNYFSLNDGDDVVDNRHSLPEPIELEIGFQCEICRNCFLFRALFEMHLCKEDDGVPIFQCKRCEKPLSSDEAEDHLNQTAKCLSNDFALNLDDASQSEGEDLVDEDVMVNRYYVRKPKANKTVLQCRVCNRRFLSLTFFRMHLCSKSEEQFFQCTNCKKKLLGPEVHQHLNQIPPCKKSISTVKRAKNTTKTTTRLRVPCSKCKEKFTVEALKYHVCSDVNPRQLKCNICGKETTLFWILKEHMFRHTDIRPLKCPECPKYFKLPLDLRIHGLKHATNHKFICDVCGHKCRNKALLAEHMLNHSDESPFKCKICDKSFKMQKRLDIHVFDVHSGIKPHICDVCGKGFPKSNKLMVHMKMHSRDKAKPAI